MAEIVSIVVRPLNQKYGDHKVEFIRVPLVVGQLVAGHGLEGDAKAGKHPDRQLNILSQEWLNQIKENGYQITPGSFGEQVIVQGIAIEDLEPGDRLQMGATATVAITKARTGCERLMAAHGQSLAALGGHVGMMANVVAGGPIQVGDPVKRVG